jgi:hypothetical protein
MTNADFGSSDRPLILAPALKDRPFAKFRGLFVLIAVMAVIEAAIFNQARVFWQLGAYWQAVLGGTLACVTIGVAWYLKTRLLSSAQDAVQTRRHWRRVRQDPHGAGGHEFLTAWLNRFGCFNGRCGRLARRSRPRFEQLAGIGTPDIIVNQHVLPKDVRNNPRDDGWPPALLARRLPRWWDILTGIAVLAAAIYGWGAVLALFQRPLQARFGKDAMDTAVGLGFVLLCVIVPLIMILWSRRPIGRLVIDHEGVVLKRSRVTRVRTIPIDLRSTWVICGEIEREDSRRIERPIGCLFSVSKQLPAFRVEPPSIPEMIASLCAHYG